jgi:ABC-2 type transport system ATP-binding protein
VKLYTGPVGGINASHGFFELRAKDTTRLQELLGNHPAIGKITLNGDLVTAILEEPMDAETINEYLFEKGLSLCYLVKRKQSLEEQFLQLTNQTNKA